MMAKHLLLTVSSNKRNLELLAQYLAKEGYDSVAAATLDELDRILTASEKIGVALVDIGGFDRGIWDRCERLRSKGIPLLVVSPKHSATLQQEGLAHGARGVLVKPLAVRELMALVHDLLGEQG